MELITYEHKAHYYETDQMGIIHHSNYIRWFEEARVYLMEALGVGYDVTEEKGIISPVLGIECEFKSMTHFNDVLEIIPTVGEYTGIKLTVNYVIRDKKTKEIRCTGTSKHCFMSKDNKILSLKRSFPELHEMFTNYKKICDENSII
ncbi:MAG: acyl-CoA thioesterase [Clostridium sp.]|uniref:acyl-CoA thioesterase n=1 Tax=Clostridium sp. TaxID=1506 RepID=UPI00290D208B|nr:acyl-CoA thioesterase [Clostridium sp.]MDU5112002.1 acyl-CoA thioesterase [Clostridium sp.]